MGNYIAYRGFNNSKLMSPKIFVIFYKTDSQDIGCFLDPCPVAYDLTHDLSRLNGSQRYTRTPRYAQSFTVAVIFV